MRKLFHSLRQKAILINSSQQSSFLLGKGGTRLWKNRTLTALVFQEAETNRWSFWGYNPLAECLHPCSILVDFWERGPGYPSCCLSPNALSKVKAAWLTDVYPTFNWDESFQDGCGREGNGGRRPAFTSSLTQAPHHFLRTFPHRHTRLRLPIKETFRLKVKKNST